VSQIPCDAQQDQISDAFPVDAIVNLRFAVADRVWFTVPQPTKWQRIGNQINAAMIFAGPEFVNVL
jgi:hypothetical protein